MSSLPVSSHITVVSSTPACVPGTSDFPLAAVSAAPATDFSRLLAHQLAVDGSLPALGPQRAAAEVVPTQGEGEEEAAAQPQPAGVPLLVLPVTPASVAPPPAAAPVVEQPPLRPEGQAVSPALLSHLPAVAEEGQMARTAPARIAAPLPELPGEADRRTPLSAPAPFLPESALPGAGEGKEAVPAVSVMSALAPAGNAPRAEGAAPVRGPFTLELPVGSSGWGTEFAQKVVWFVREGQSVAQIHVTPPQLGPLEIRLSLDQDQASMVFVSAHATVREAIEAAMPRLREMLAESGLTLGSVDVATQSFAGREGERERGGGFSAPSQPTATLAAPPWRGGEGLVDVFV